MKKGKTMKDYFLRQEKAQKANSYGEVCMSTGNYRENIVHTVISLLSPEKDFCN